MRRKSITLSVKVDFPPHADDEDVAAFTMDALECMGGSRHPDDSMFPSLSVHSVKIRNTTYTNPQPKDNTY